MRWSGKSRTTGKAKGNTGNEQRFNSAPDFKDGNDRAKRSITTTIKQSNKMEELENVKAYAKELEDIIERVTIPTNQRILVNALVGRAKEKYHMYNNQ